MSDLMQGFSISIIGLLITFFALGVFILLMIVLQRIFPPKAEAQEEEEKAELVVQIELDQESSQMDEDGAVAAAIAAAVSYFQAAYQSSLGANLEGGRGRWWAENRSTAGRVSNLRKN